MEKYKRFLIKWIQRRKINKRGIVRLDGPKSLKISNKKRHEGSLTMSGNFKI